MTQENNPDNLYDDDDDDDDFEADVPTEEEEEDEDVRRLQGFAQEKETEYYSDMQGMKKNYDAVRGQIGDQQVQLIFFHLDVGLGELI
jgi:hypothetical protein